MKNITLTDSDGVVITGRLPRSWSEVGLAHYAALAVATNWPDRCRALAALCELPAQPFLDDVSLCLPILRGAPFLLDGPLPMPGTPPNSFRHLGITYVPAPANLEQIRAGQLEGLTAFLREYEGNALAAAPHLLAVLYKPEGSELTSAVVEASAAAFTSLPMAIGYALLLDFWQRSASWALPIQRYLAVRPVVEQTLNALETLSRPSASPGRSWNIVRWLIAIWTRHVKKALKTS
ncbi:hypothetical protein [Hymenobacter arizonensis]|uniref:Uncharacterized protein n=1 Tax=Hymenobacter arizonensis TaxID=1227077 RepID=A0A1I5T889_HYMAR|nr:hypothetical protein [Hymenobacter arizonensis]SFP79250.1 hypothetical protein SAMN04515668_0360 [Hymenobacter arizonensis]